MQSATPSGDIVTRLLQSRGANLTGTFGRGMGSTLDCSRWAAMLGADMDMAIMHGYNLKRPTDIS